MDAAEIQWRVDETPPAITKLDCPPEVASLDLPQLCFSVLEDDGSLDSPGLVCLYTSIGGTIELKVNQPTNSSLYSCGFSQGDGHEEVMNTAGQFRAEVTDLAGNKAVIADQVLFLPNLGSALSEIPSLSDGGYDLEEFSLDEIDIRDLLATGSDNLSTVAADTVPEQCGDGCKHLIDIIPEVPYLVQVINKPFTTRMYNTADLGNIYTSL